jgi:copper homeostasis protein
VAAAERAVAEGADRLEVCGDLSVGGITPSPALLAAALATGVPCVAMARPRGGPFVLSEADRAATLHDAERVLAAGAHGVVFGGLTAHHRVDVALTAAIVNVAGASEAVFHRAFDDSEDPLADLDTLRELGVTRVLTAGGRSTAWDGRGQLALYVRRAQGRITVLPGGGVRGPHAAALLNATGADQLHARATDPGVIAALRAAVSG